MDRNELVATEKRVTERLKQVQKDLKRSQEIQEELTQFSKEGQKFFQEILGFLHGSSAHHIFQDLYDEQVSLDKKVKSDFEREYDDLQQEHRRLMSQSDALSLELRKLEKEEMHGR